MTTKRKILRTAVDIGILCSVSVYGSLHVWWHGLVLCVVVAAYGLFCFWDGVDDASWSRRQPPVPNDPPECAETALDEYLQTGNIDALARYDAAIPEALRGWQEIHERARTATLQAD